MDRNDLLDNKLVVCLCTTKLKDRVVLFLVVKTILEANLNELQPVRHTVREKKHVKMDT